MARLALDKINFETIRGRNEEPWDFNAQPAPGAPSSSDGRRIEPVFPSADRAANPEGQLHTFRVYTYLKPTHFPIERFPGLNALLTDRMIRFTICMDVGFSKVLGHQSINHNLGFHRKLTVSVGVSEVIGTQGNRNEL